MALINCPECDRQVSDKAAACPSCGCPLSSVAAPPVPRPAERPRRAPASDPPYLPSTLGAVRRWCGDPQLYGPEPPPGQPMFIAATVIVVLACLWDVAMWKSTETIRGGYMSPEVQRRIAGSLTVWPALAVLLALAAVIIGFRRRSALLAWRLNRAVSRHDPEE